MGCCSWPLGVIAWIMGSYSRTKYEEESDSSEDSPVPKFQDIPVPGFRELGPMKQRFTRTYNLRTTKVLSYAEDDDSDMMVD